MSEMENIIVTKTSTRIIIVTEMIGVGPIFPHKIVKFLLATVEVLWFELRIFY